MIPRLPDGFSHPVRIGEGAFASVYRVRQTALERWVALKLIIEKDREKRHELLREARTQAHLTTGCVPQIYDAFEWSHRVCIVMEWVRGIPLSTLLAGTLTSDERLLIGGSLVRAVAAIHGLGFVHRDLKPENILISPERGLFLVDFGFTKSIAELQTSAVGVAKGTPVYMAPELWSSGGDIDLMRADIYATGKILLQLLSSTPCAAFTAPLVHEDPARRPASGADLLQLWENNIPLPAQDVNWHRITGETVARLQSDSLLNAAERLLLARRSDEAYWLLVESLEENGNNARALELMGNFQQRTDNKKFPVHIVLFAAILVLATAAAFFAGMLSRDAAQSGTALPGLANLGMRLTSATIPPSLRPAVILREDSVRTDRLGGRIIIRGIPSATRIMIDNVDAEIAAARFTGIICQAGEHAVTLLDSTGHIVRHEYLRLLPFQTKVIDIPSEGNRTP